MTRDSTSNPGRDAKSGPKVRPERSGPLQVELISTGRELLRGLVQDANAAIVARALTERGAFVRRITVVDDRAEAVTAAVREALSRNPHLVVTSGGLGPAADDLTLAGVAAALDLPLGANARARAMVEASYAKLHRAGVVPSAGMNASREKLCRLPVGSVPVPNPTGVAPGVICRITGGSAVLCLPGMRHELKAVLEAALPLLDDLAPRLSLAQREIESPTTDESALRPLLERLAAEHEGVWISSRAPGPGQQGHRILVLLEAVAPTATDANAAVDRAVRRLLALASGSR